jgi:phosphate transport system substrate-binding protein
MKRLLARSVLLLAAAALVRADVDLVGQNRPPPPVDPELPSYEPCQPLTGDLHIVGGGGVPGSYCESMIRLWVDIFKRAHPLVHVHTAIYSSGATPPDLAEEYAQIGFMTREILPFEEALFRHKKWKLLEIPVVGATYDSIGISSTQVIIVNSANPIEHLSMPELDAIFSSTRNLGYGQDIATWGQLGLGGAWADKPVHPLGSTEMPNGSTMFFIRRALRGGRFKGSVRQVTTAGTPGAVAADPNAIGFAYLQRNEVWPQTKAVALVPSAGAPAVPLTYETVLNRTWPLSRLIYAYVNSYPDKPIDPLAKEFLRVILSREGQAAAARTPFMPLPAANVNASLDLLR